ncbi:uncharacterized protein LOC110390466, partial [Numida meleagris]|uniref:uncharacterized protein LOC110390466 n=1 Tax=Numida meleagris TaxID=8996 RepID=UPI000B3DB51A
MVPCPHHLRRVPPMCVPPPGDRAVPTLSPQVELATGQFPYQNCKTDFEVLTKVLQEDPPLLPPAMGFSGDFQAFVRDCLTKDHRKRPKYNKLLVSPTRVPVSPRRRALSPRVSVSVCPHGCVLVPVSVALGHRQGPGDGVCVSIWVSSCPSPHLRVPMLLCVPMSMSPCSCASPCPCALACPHVCVPVVLSPCPCAPVCPCARVPMSLCPCPHVPVLLHVPMSMSPCPHVS